MSLWLPRPQAAGRVRGEYDTFVHPSQEAPPALTPLPYHTPPDRRQIFSWPVFIVCACVIAMLFGVFGYLFPRLQAIYVEFAVWLPGVTRVVFLGAQFMKQRGLLLSTSLPLVLGFLVPFALARKRRPLTREQAWILVLIIVNILLTVALTLVIIAWVLPMYRLITAFFR
jgi:hypothetical protein